MPDGEATMPREHHHRDVTGGLARASVFGVSDGLVSNVSLILGVAGAEPSASLVRLAGLAGLVAGALSMAAGEWVSMKAQAELLERELEMERIELRRNPAMERAELAAIYRSRGVPEDVAEDLATAMMRDPDVALETHAREELGIDPGSLGSPRGAALSSFGAFAVGAVVPLAPWFVATGRVATLASVVLAVVAAATVGFALARFTGRSPVRSAARQVLIAGVASGATYLIGSALGVDLAA